MSMHFQITARAAITGLQLLVPVLCTAHVCVTHLKFLTLGKKTQFTKAVNYRERTTVLCKLQENWSLQIVGPFAMVYKVVNML